MQCSLLASILCRHVGANTRTWCLPTNQMPLGISYLGLQAITATPLHILRDMVTMKLSSSEIFHISNSRSQCSISYTFLQSLHLFHVLLSPFHSLYLFLDGALDFLLPSTSVTLVLHLEICTQTPVTLSETVPSVQKFHQILLPATKFTIMKVYFRSRSCKFWWHLICFITNKARLKIKGQS